MKRQVGFLSAVLLLAATTVHANNVIPDPSFENASSWTMGDAASSIASSVARTGSKSLKLVNDGSKTKNHNAGQYSIDGVQPNTEYVYSVWVRGTAVTGKGAGGKPLAVVRWRDSSNNRIVDEMYMWAPYGTYSWEKMFFYLQSPPKAARVDISFRSWWVAKIDEGCLSGTTHWDDAALVPRDLSHRGKLAGSYQANAASSSGGVIASEEPNASGGGYFHPKSSGAFLQWSKVAGGVNGGARILAFRYAWEGNAKLFEVFVNGKSQGSLKPVATGRRSSWASFELPVTLKPGNNSVKIVVSKVTAGPNIDRLDVYYEAGTIPPPDAGGKPDQAVPKDAGIKPDQPAPKDTIIEPDSGSAPDAAQWRDSTAPDGFIPQMDGSPETIAPDPATAVDAQQPNNATGDSTLDGGCAVGSRPSSALWWLLLVALLRGRARLVARL